MGWEDAVAAEAARPMPWFRHDADASADIKSRRLLRRLGMEGYGRWWRLCELMAAASGHRLSLETDEDAEILADELMLGGAREAVAFVGELADVGLVTLDEEGRICSGRLDREARKFGENRVKGRRGGRPRKVSTDEEAESAKNVEK